MKKFTLLIAMLLCFVAFGQKASTPTVEYPTKATSKAEKKQVSNQGKLPYANFTEVPESVIAGVKARVASAKAKKVVTSVHRGSMTSPNARVAALLERYASVGNQTGDINQFFTAEEMTILKHHLNASNQTYKKTAVVNTTSNSSELVAGANQTLGLQTKTFDATHFNGYSYKNTGGTRMPVLAYSSGPYFNIPGTPDISRLENTTLGMTTLGAGVQVLNNNRIAEDIILADDYDVTELVFYAYQTGAPTSPPTINEINVQIWDGDPTVGGSTVIWGDNTTNVLNTVAWSNAYRDSETSPGDTQRAIYRLTVDATGLSLPAGTYWVDWQIGGTLASGPWQPPVSILGQNTTGNAMQNLAGAGFNPLLDGGSGTALGAPIEVYGDCTSCGGGGGPVTAYGYESQTISFGSFESANPAVYNIIATSPNDPGANFEGAGAIDPNGDGSTAYALTANNTLYSIDVATGVYTSLGTVAAPGGGSWVGLEFDPVSGTLYGLSGVFTVNTTLSSIDIGTLTATTIGTNAGSACAVTFAIDSAGVGYLTDVCDDSLWSVDLATGALALVGPTGIDLNFGQAMCYDINTDQLYTAAFNNAAFTAEWRSVDTATGATTLVGAINTPNLTQIAWVGMPDAGGGGGGGGCTTGVYTDRPSFDAETGAISLEDFAGGPGAITACDGPINSSGNSCYPAGEILDGIDVRTLVPTDPTQNTVVIPNGALGQTGIYVGPNFFSDVLEIQFPNNDVNSFGVDVLMPLAGIATDIEVRIFGTGGQIDTQIVTATGNTTPVFFGYIASETITRVEMEDPLGGGELIANASFGECAGGGGGGGGCGDITYENVAPTGNGVPAQTFPDFPDFDCEAVDDVVLAGPDAGQLCAVSVTGTYTAGGLPADPNNTVVLTVYSDSAGQPGSVIFTETFPGSVDGNADGSFTLEPTGGPTFNPGTRYWISVNAVMEFGTSGQWFWSSATDGNDDPALWQNPLGGFGVGCTTWGDFAACGVGGGLGPDLLMDVDFEEVTIITYDDCEGALSLDCGDTVMGDTLSATLDPVTDCDPGTPDAPGVWYKFEDTAGLPGTALVSTCSANTDYDTQITVYTGDCVGGLVCLATNDDSANCTNFQSEVEFDTDGSSTYYIMVHGWNGATGNFELSLSCTLTPPDNDMIVNAIDLDEVGCPFTDEDVAMPAATTENGTPTDCDITGAAGVWYKFTPEGDGFITCTIATPGAGVGSTNLSVNNGPLAGDYNPVAAGFGGAIPLSPLTEDAVIVNDDDTTGDPNDACDPILNGVDINGKIAVLRRGSCEFGFKALAAQNEGAVAVVVVNNQPGDPIVMGGGAVGDQVTIPVVMISDVEGEPIIAELLASNTVNMTLFGTLPDVSSVTFYTAPDETSTEDELVLVDYFQNQCVPGTTATIPTIAGQAYYCFVVNTGAVSDIIFDNCDSLSNDSNEIEGFVFYPNPANDRLNLSSVELIESVALYNILGQKVIDLDVNATTTQLDVSRLSVGAYLMKVSSNGQTGTYKVIKK